MIASRARRVVIVIALVSALAIPVRATRCEEAVYQHAVAADHALASEVGVEILKQGGNVVDAAAAVGFALSVLRPASSGIGGGGFMLIWDAKEQRCIVLDYRERAPLRATAEMFVEDAQNSENGEQALPKQSVRTAGRRRSGTRCRIVPRGREVRAASNREGCCARRFDWLVTECRPTRISSRRGSPP